MNNEVKKVFFIVNRFSGTGYSSALEDAIANTAGEHHAAFKLAFTEGPGHATALAQRAVNEGYEAVVAAGGDGTVNEVAQGLLHTSVKMGILPKGSGNGLARHLKIPLSARGALRCLFSAQVLTMDTFRINGRLSVNVSGIGFDGHVAGLFAANKKRGLQTYTRLVLHEFRRFAEFDVRMRAGENELACRAFVVAIANSSQYGNNARIAPAASISDGLLDIAVLKKFAPYRLDFIYSFFSGRIHQTTCCRAIQVRDAVIELDQPMPYHIDGEFAGTDTRFSIALMPSSLRILAPYQGVKF